MNRQDIGLYFIALIPPEELRKRVKTLKEEMKVRFNAGHALKSPAHITLQMPFKRNHNDEVDMVAALEEFVSHEKPFPIDLNGFSCFLPRVIFVKITDHTSIVNLQSRLGAILISNLGFEPKAINPRLHPHMTIATRDLEKESFYRAWSEFESRQFQGSFLSSSMALLKHNGRCWDLFREFPFGS